MKKSKAFMHKFMKSAQSFIEINGEILAYLI